MKPVVLLVIGILNIFGQSMSYRINDDILPHLKALRVRREIDSQHYAFEDNNQNPVKKSQTTPEDHTTPVKVSNVLIGDANFTNKKESFDSKNVAPLNTNPIQAYDGKSYNQGYSGNGYSKEHNGNEYNQVQNGYSDGYNQDNNGSRYSQRHTDYGYNQGQNGDSYSQDNNGYGYSQGQNGNVYNQRQTGEGYNQGNNGNGYSQGHNGYRYNQGNYGSTQGQNGGGYRQGTNDYSYSQSISNAQNGPATNWVNRYIENEMGGLAPAFGIVNPTNYQRYPFGNRKKYTYNVASTSPNIDRKVVYSDGKYPDTVYTYNPKSVVNYRDENSEVLTMNDNHITVVQPPRNKVVIHRSYPDYKVTTYRDDPANGGMIPHDDTQTAYGISTPKPLPSFEVDNSQPGNGPANSGGNNTIPQNSDATTIRNNVENSDNINFDLNVAGISSKVDRKEVNSGGKYPDTVYTSNPKSVVTYTDGNSEVLTMNDNHITVVQPKRNKVVIHKSNPNYTETVIKDVPANIDLQHDYDYRNYDTHLNRNFQNTRTSQGFTTTKPPYRLSPPNNGISNTTPQNNDAARNNGRNSDNSNQYSSDSAYDSKGRNYGSDNADDSPNNSNNRQTQNNSIYMGSNNGYSGQNNGQTVQDDQSRNGLYRSNNSFIKLNNDSIRPDEGVIEQNNSRNRESDGYITLNNGHGSSSIGNSSSTRDNNGKPSYGPINPNTGYPSHNISPLADPLPTPSVQVAERHNIERMKKKYNTNEHDQVNRAVDIN